MLSAAMDRDRSDEADPSFFDTALMLASLDVSAGNRFDPRVSRSPNLQHGLEETPMTTQPVPPLPDAVVLINPFRVPAAERGAFLANYRATMERLSLQDGFLGGGLHELLEPVGEEAFDFVNVNHWRSIEAFRAGLAAANPSGIFGDQVARLEAHPGLFRVASAYGSWTRSAAPPACDAADRLAIMEVASRFETTFDRGELDAHMELWTEALSFESPYMGIFNDRASYRKGLQNFYEDLAAKGGTRHLMTNFEIDLAGDRARVRSYLAVYNRKSGATLGIVEWQDEMVRTEAGWRYVRRLQVP
jgi:heme-degrading monooxygenase HmoA